jgi:hypothetical protein
MQYRVFVVLTAAMMLGASPVAERPFHDQIARDRLNPKIGPAVVSRYESIREATNWKNPFVTPVVNGVSLRLGDWESEPQSIALADLRQALIKLPVNGWPYGAVVALGSGYGPTNLRDAPVIAENRTAARAILESLKVTIDDWP